MSIYAIMAFNSALDRMNQLTQQSQQIQQSKQNLDEGAQKLDILKRTKEAQINVANDQGQLTDFMAKKMLDQLKGQASNATKLLNAHSDAADANEHQNMQELQSTKQAADTLMQNPDVQQWHVGSLLSAANGAPSSVTEPTAMSGVNPLTAGKSGVEQQASNPAIPSIFPMTSQAPSMIQKTQQIPLNASEQFASGPVPAPMSAGPMAAPQPEQPAQPQSQEQPVQQQNPLMDANNYYFNPSSGKMELNPFFKTQQEAKIKAQASVEATQPRFEARREDMNTRTASTLLANAVKTGPIGTQNAKVDQAIHARALINSAYDPKTGDFNVTQVPYGELGETLSSLLAGKTGSSDARVAAVKQKTAQGDLNSFLTYWNGKPSNATSQEAIKQTIDIIDRQGEVAEEERNNAVDKLKELPVFKRLNDDDFQSIKALNLGNSFKDALKSSPDKQSPQSVPQSTIPDGRIEVVSPDGKRGHIPEGQLEEAIKAGYKKAQ